MNWIIARMKTATRRHWALLALLGGIWALACMRLMVDLTPRVPLLFNFTPSLPYTVAVLEGRRILRRGDYIVFRFDGSAKDHYAGLGGQPLFKQVVGLPGDIVSVDGRAVAVNGHPVGMAKTHAFDRRPLSPIEPGVIPAGHYFVAGTSPDSLDSRYRESGLVSDRQVIGSVIPLF
jgi:conjugal transfer pilin signal peptidase TrbI